MSTKLVAASLIAFLVSMAVGQPTANPPAKGQSDSGRNLEERARKRSEHLAYGLNLSEQQRAELSEIVRAHDGKMEEHRGILSEILQGMLEKDAGRAKEARANLDEIVELMNDPTNSLYEELETILTDEQVGLLQEKMRLGRGAKTGQTAQLALLRAQLDLTDEQGEKFDEIVAAHVQIEGAGRQHVMKSLGRELQRARQAGNAQRAAELEERLREMQAADQAKPQDVFAKLESILDANQIQIMHTFQKRGSQGRTRAADNTRNIFRAVKRVELNNEQRRSIKRLERTARQKRAALRTEGGEAEAAYAIELRTKITGLLEPEQVAQFEKNMARLGKMRRPKASGKP